MNTIQELSNLAGDRNYQALSESRQTMLVERMKLDKFFSLFLDKFERKMDPENTDTPIWKLYKNKLKEYEELQRSIKSSTYYLTRHNV
jgi:hypothetical protein